MDWRQVEQGFSSFFAKCLIFQSGAHCKCCGTLQNQTFGLAFNPFFGWFRVPENRISSIRSATRITLFASRLKSTFKKIWYKLLFITLFPHFFSALCRSAREWNPISEHKKEIHIKIQVSLESEIFCWVLFGRQQRHRPRFWREFFITQNNFCT